MLRTVAGNFFCFWILILAAIFHMHWFFQILAFAAIAKVIFELYKEWHLHFADRFARSEEASPSHDRRPPVPRSSLTWQRMRLVDSEESDSGFEDEDGEFDANEGGNANEGGKIIQHKHDLKSGDLKSGGVIPDISSRPKPGKNYASSPPIANTPSTQSTSESEWIGKDKSGKSDDSEKENQKVEKNWSTQAQVGDDLHERKLHAINSAESQLSTATGHSNTQGGGFSSQESQPAGTTGTPTVAGSARSSIRKLTNPLSEKLPSLPKVFTKKSSNSNASSIDSSSLDENAIVERASRRLSANRVSVSNPSSGNAAMGRTQSEKPQRGSRRHYSDEVSHGRGRSPGRTSQQLYEAVKRLSQKNGDAEKDHNHSEETTFLKKTVCNIDKLGFHFDRDAKITTIVPGQWGEEIGLQFGDVIMEVDGVVFPGLSEVEKIKVLKMSRPVHINFLCKRNVSRAPSPEHHPYSHAKHYHTSNGNSSLPPPLEVLGHNQPGHNHYHGTGKTDDVSKTASKVANTGKGKEEIALTSPESGAAAPNTNPANPAKQRQLQFAEASASMRPGKYAREVEESIALESRALGRTSNRASLRDVPARCPITNMKGLESQKMCPFLREHTEKSAKSHASSGTHNDPEDRLVGGTGAVAGPVTGHWGRKKFERLYEGMLKRATRTHKRPGTQYHAIDKPGKVRKTLARNSDKGRKSQGSGIRKSSGRKSTSNKSSTASNWASENASRIDMNHVYVSFWDWLKICFTIRISLLINCVHNRTRLQLYNWLHSSGIIGAIRELLGAKPKRKMKHSIDAAEKLNCQKDMKEAAARKNEVKNTTETTPMATSEPKKQKRNTAMEKSLQSILSDINGDDNWAENRMSEYVFSRLVAEWLLEIPATCLLYQGKVEPLECERISQRKSQNGSNFQDKVAELDLMNPKKDFGEWVIRSMVMPTNDSTLENPIHVCRRLTMIVDLQERRVVDTLMGPIEGNVGPMGEVLDPEESDPSEISESDLPQTLDKLLKKSSDIMLGKDKHGNDLHVNAGTNGDIDGTNGDIDASQPMIIPTRGSDYLEFLARKQSFRSQPSLSDSRISRRSTRQSIDTGLKQNAKDKEDAIKEQNLAEATEAQVISLPPQDTYLLLTYYGASSHTQAHALANWGCDVESNHSFIREMSVITTVYNFFGLVGGPAYLDPNQVSGFGAGALHYIFECPIYRHDHLLELSKYSSCVRFVAGVRRKFIATFDELKKDEANNGWGLTKCDGEALFVGSVIHTLDHVLPNDITVQTLQKCKKEAASYAKSPFLLRKFDDILTHFQPKEVVMVSGEHLSTNVLHNHVHTEILRDIVRKSYSMLVNTHYPESLLKHNFRDVDHPLFKRTYQEAVRINPVLANICLACIIM